MMKSLTFSELLYPHYCQKFEIDSVIFEQKTTHQHLIIFENAMYGRVMALDGVIQTTEKDEFIYHEMLTHVPIIAHGQAKQVLIIGGGDGGILREVLRHKSIVRATQVEIDAAVIEMSKKYLPHHSNGAYDDPRAHIVVDDGYNFVAHCNEKYDLIISDSTDPFGPGEMLFSEHFYRHCKNCLNPDGIMVTQNGVAFHQLSEARSTHNFFKNIYQDASFYCAAVPTYIGGVMNFGWGTDNQQHRQLAMPAISQRWQAANIRTRYYNPAIHAASFALPQYVIEALEC